MFHNLTAWVKYNMLVLRPLKSQLYMCMYRGRHNREHRSREETITW
jgi:hypothetical protein